MSPLPRESAGRLVAGRRLAAVALLLLGAPGAASAFPRQEVSPAADRSPAERTSDAPGTPETAPLPARSALARAFDWTVGAWKGIRRDGGRTWTVLWIDELRRTASQAS